LAGNAGNLTNIGIWNTAMRGGFEFEKFAWPSTYRGICKSTDEFLAEAEETLNSTSHGKVAGFIFEPIQGAGGIYTLP
jgi:4-aminobutyrate aminotransferase-like enzyme